VTSVAKVNVDENRLVKQQDLLAEEIKAKENKLKSFTFDFNSKLKSLRVKIENLEDNHATLTLKLLSSNSAVDAQKKEVDDLMCELKSCDQDILSASSMAECLNDEIRRRVEETESDTIHLRTQEELFSSNKDVSDLRVAALELELKDIQKSCGLLEKKEAALLESNPKLLADAVQICHEKESLDKKHRESVAALMLQLNTLKEQDIQSKEVAQAAEAKLISLHIEEKELETGFEKLTAQAIEVETKLQILSNSKLDSLPQLLRDELLPVDEIEAIKAEVIKRQEVASEQKNDSELDSLIEAEKLQHRLVRELLSSFIYLFCF
jgi:hypothetical protein